MKILRRYQTYDEVRAEQAHYTARKVLTTLSAHRADALCGLSDAEWVALWYGPPEAGRPRCTTPRCPNDATSGSYCPVCADSWAELASGAEVAGC